MSAAGDAVVAVARSQIGVTEDPPYSSNVPYWDWWGSPAAGAWCAVFGSWAAAQAGFPLCAVDGWGGFTYCPNGTSHSYPEGEALPTAGIYPGVHVIYSWYGWGWENGVPVINDGSEWDGWIAGDHWGIATSTVDGDGWFTAVEGNTSPTDSGSQDNGGGVWEKWRHISQVCAWYQPPSYGDSPIIDPAPEQPPPPPGFEEHLDMIIGQDQFDGRIFLISGNTKLEFPVGGGDPNWPGRGNVYVDEWIRMVRESYPGAPELRLCALNHDIASRLPNVLDLVDKPPPVTAMEVTMTEEDMPK